MDSKLLYNGLSCFAFSHILHTYKKKKQCNDNLLTWGNAFWCNVRYFSVSFRLKMAHPGDTFLYVETNLGTRIAIPMHSEATVSQFKEIFCREHKENWPEFGDIQISAVKIEQEDKLYRIVDSMTWSLLFQGIRGERHINVEVENGDLVTIQADAPSASTDTESNWQQSVGAPVQPTHPSEVSRPPDTAQRKDETEEVDQCALGGVDKTEDKTKKRKRESEKEKESCGDDKTGDIDVKKEDDVGALSRCSCEAQGTKKLLVFDLKWNSCRRAWV